MATGTRLRPRWGERSYSLFRNLQSAFRPRHCSIFPIRNSVDRIEKSQDSKTA